MTFEWEKEQFIQLESDLNMGVIQQGSKDKVVWDAEEGGEFSVKSAYGALHLCTPSESDQAMKVLCDIKVIPNVLTLAWRILKGRVPTRDNLRRKGVTLTSLLCPLSNEEEETVSHLFGVCVVSF